MMNRLGMFLLTIVLASPAFADQDVSRTIDASADGRVYVSIISGSVSVRPWSKRSVEVTGTLGPKVEELIVAAKGDKIIIKVKVPRRGGRGIDADLTINVPTKSSLDIGTVSAEIDVAGVSGELQLASVSGEIDTEFAGSEVSAESVSGNVNIHGDGAEGDFEASSVSGNVILRGLAGMVSAESVSGNVFSKDNAFAEADFETVTGNIDYSGRLPKDGEITIETVNGDVDIMFDGKVSADIEVSTFNGRIRNCFGPKAEKASRYGPGWELDFTAGDGDGDVEISTLNGGVNICQD